MSGRWRHKFSSSHIGQYRMVRNFCGTKLLQFSRICLRPWKFYLQCKPHLFSAIGVAYIQSVDYFCEFSECLCNGNVPLAWTSYPKLLPGFVGVKNMLEESVGEGKWGCYVKLSPDVDDGYRALFGMAAPQQWLYPRIFINVVSTHHRFDTKLTRHHWTFTSGVGVVSIHPVWAWLCNRRTVKIFREILARGQSTENFFLAKNFSPYGILPTTFSSWGGRWVLLTPSQNDIL